jgi:uncharacterized membrane protein
MAADVIIAKRERTIPWELLAAAAVLFLAVLVRWERLGTRNLWPDEAFSLDLARQSFAELLNQLRGNDAHPLGYYMLLSHWIRAVGEDLALMRAPSAAFGVGAVVLTWLLGRRLFSASVGIGAAALVALNPFQIFASNELRMYTALEFLALGSTLLLWHAHTVVPRAHDFARRYGWWMAYGASLAAMAYFSYYAFLLIPAHLIWILRHQSLGVVVRRLGVALATAAALYAPWVPYLASLAAFLRGNPLVWRGQAIWPTYVPELFAAQTFGGYLFNTVSYHSAQALPLKAYALLLSPFVALTSIGYAALGKLNRPARSLIALSWVIPVVLVVLISLAVRKVFAYHYHVNFLTPFLALFLAAGVVHLRDRVTGIPGPLVTLGAAIVVLAFVAPAIENLQGNPAYQFYRYDLAGQLVKKLYQPGDVVVFLPRGVSRGFHFYFDPPGREFGIPLDRERYSRQALRDAINDVAQSLTPEDRKLWLVYSPPIPQGTVEDLLQALERQGYQRAAVNDFKGLRVGLLVRRVR